MNKVFFLFALLICLLLSCSDPCKSVNCLNGGDCVEGDCLCTDRWLGSDCSVQKTPKRILVNNLAITNFPQFKEDGSSWDRNSPAPDVNISITDENLNFVGNTTSIANANNDVWTTFPEQFQINSPKVPHVLFLWDDDGIESADAMDVIGIEFYNDTNQFPSTLNIGPSSQGTMVRMDLEYQF